MEKSCREISFDCGSLINICETNSDHVVMWVVTFKTIKEIKQTKNKPFLITSSKQIANHFRVGETSLKYLNSNFRISR